MKTDTDISSNHQPITSGSLLELPETQPWPEPVNGKVLLDDLAGLLRRFVILPAWAPETLALWTLHTYAFHLRDVTAYIGLESPEKRCGKTTLLSVLLELVNRPIVAANISSPAFFRVIEETRPTLLIDEADTLLQGNDELRGILNSGYSRKTAFVVRIAHQAVSPPPSINHQPSTINYPRPSPLKRFSCWCPKILAAIGRLPDTLADRCILVRMHRKTHYEQCERLKNLNPANLKQQCARFILDHSEAIAAAQPEIPNGLNDRASDIWEPLLTLADLAGGDWPGLARQAAVNLTALAQDHNPIGSLLLDIFRLLRQTKHQRIFSRDLVAGLNKFAGRPWKILRNGKEITDIWLSQQLRPYGIKPANITIDGVQAKGYLQDDLMEIFRRYITKADIDTLSPKPDSTPS